MATLADIISSRIRGGEIATSHRTQVMEFTDERDIGIERDEMDYVSRWILSLAIGMIVLGTAFAVLDWCDLLPPLPTAAAVAHAA
jgi:hypothetical protein